MCVKQTSLSFLLKVMDIVSMYSNSIFEIIETIRERVKEGFKFSSFPFKSISRICEIS